MTKKTIKQQILTELKKRPMSASEVSKLTGISTINATKRLHGLFEEGEIGKFGTTRGENGRALTIWGVGEPPSELINESNSLMTRITTALDSGDMTIDQMAEKCRTSRYKAINAIKRLIKSGEVIKVRSSKGSMPAIYGLKGRERKTIKPVGVDRVAAKKFMLYKPKKGEVVWCGVRC